jgi:hypothetical protein
VWQEQKLSLVQSQKYQNALNKIEKNFDSRKMSEILNLLVQEKSLQEKTARTVTRCVLAGIAFRGSQNQAEINLVAVVMVASKISQMKRLKVIRSH